VAKNLRSRTPDTGETDMAPYVPAGGLRVHSSLYYLIRDEIAPETGIDPNAFWTSLGEIVRDLGPKNRRLLDRREALQARIDDWHRQRRGQPLDGEEYKAFLEEIGYLVPEGEDFQITTADIDRAIAEVAGPQLVVPVDNARYALNAANARWGSLYDALYGSDVISEEDGAEKRGAYNPVRGARVIAFVEGFLDKHVGLERGSYSDVTEFFLEKRAGRDHLLVTLKNGERVNGERVGLADPAAFVAFRQLRGRLTSILLLHQGLHIEIQIDRDHPVGKDHPAGVKDVVLEAAVTTIIDCEDSVAAVDAEDKARVYRNWFGIMSGALEATFDKDGRSVRRRLNADRLFNAPDEGVIMSPGRSLLLVRNVGLHMYTDAVTTPDGQPIPEGFLDAMVTSLAAIHDLEGMSLHRNSRRGSVYIVKPKLHGPEEVAATVELFARVEDALGLARNTMKIGIMDEERRTTVNLKECIRQARERVVFINTGFLDRTGDEIHTSMEAGPMIPKMEIKSARWMLAYEDWNVDVGIATGLPGRAQIGKGMWTMPDRMRAMVEAKGAHPQAGASTAWVPSPTAATLHALHYHEVNVAARQAALAERPWASLDDILTPPLLGSRTLSAAEIQRDLENNAQGILGYVVRWVEQGIGCSKIPDIHDVGLMEDRATLRISSQHIANWLHHGITNREQVLSTFRKMAAVVDRQNAGDPNYRAMAPAFDASWGFRAALDLVFQGRAEPNGYTERVLTAYRRQAKASEQGQPQAPKAL
jgi:malate synthase